MTEAASLVIIKYIKNAPLPSSHGVLVLSQCTSALCLFAQRRQRLWNTCWTLRDISRMKTHSCCLKWKTVAFTVVCFGLLSLLLLLSSAGFIILRILKRFLLMYFAKYISVAHIFIFLFIFKLLGSQSPEWFRKFNTFWNEMKQQMSGAFELISGDVTMRCEPVYSQWGCWMIKVVATSNEETRKSTLFCSATIHDFSIL